jgi:hypothetical protein
VEMESSACVPKVGSLASRARNGKMRALFCAQLGKNRIHSIELALVRARGKYLIANALTYFHPATTMRDMLLICQETAQRVAVFGCSILQLTEGMRQGPESLGCSVRCAHTPAMSSGESTSRWKQSLPTCSQPATGIFTHKNVSSLGTQTVNNGILLKHTP